jgi:hypothetical protein
VGLLGGMAGELPSSIIAAIDFIGRSHGAVKTLGGFKKSHHTLPDSANATTNAFLGKICAGELSLQAEQLFQKVRTGLDYKRKDLALTVTAPGAVLIAKDFAVEIIYALEASNPERYEVQTTLRELRDPKLARGGELAAIFHRMFSEISFGLKNRLQVEAMVDAIEALDDAAGLSVTYPSDCSTCTVTVAGVDAQVQCSEDSLAVVFRQAGSPRELIDGFEAIRSSFRVSPELAGVIA